MSETVEAPARVTLGNYVGGEWRGARSGETYEKRNPMRPDEVVAEVPACDADDVDDAVAAAREAFPGWAATPAPQRGNLLVKAAEVVDTRVEEIASEMTREMGKPLREARMEAARAATILRFFGGEGYRPLGELSQQTMTGGPVYTMRRPLGVVGLITPWNFPAAIPAWKLAPALATATRSC
jgi:aldehyde dehydrogenase (NAD+)